MAQSALSIITRATQIAKCPNYTAQALNFLNAILGDLCETHDFALARGLFTGTFDPGVTTVVNGVSIFGGPITLPTDYLRTSGSTGSTGAQKSAYWYNLGVPYPMVPCDLADFDMQVQQSGNNSYPWLWATDMSQSPPVAYVYPPAAGAYPFFVRYQKQMPDLSQADVDDGAFCWFPNDGYLVDELAGRLMQITDDSRVVEYLGDERSIGRAGRRLTEYLKLKDDTTNRTDTVQMDRRSFGSAFSRLRNTKQVGW